MRFRIASRQDLWAGLMFAAIGATALFVSRDYPMGEATRMGPGYFPTYVSAITMALGALIALRSLRIEGEKVGGFAWRAGLLLSLGFAAFGWGIERIGLVGSLAALIALSAAARPGFKPLEVALLAAALSATSWAIFVYALGLPLRPWP